MNVCLLLIQSGLIVETHTHTHIYIYILIYVCNQLAQFIRGETDGTQVEHLNNPKIIQNLGGSNHCGGTDSAIGCGPMDPHSSRTVHTLCAQVVSFNTAMDACTSNPKIPDSGHRWQLICALFAGLAHAKGWSAISWVSWPAGSPELLASYYRYYRHELKYVFRFWTYKVPTCEVSHGDP